MGGWSRQASWALGVALLTSTAFTSTQEVPRLTCAPLVDSIRAELDLTQQITSLSGKDVAIQGLIIPAGRPDLTFFLLSRVSSIGHDGGEAPVGQDETVYVFAARADQVTDNPLRV